MVACAPPYRSVAGVVVANKTDGRKIIDTKYCGVSDRDGRIVIDKPPGGIAEITRANKRAVEKGTTITNASNRAAAVALHKDVSGDSVRATEQPVCVGFNNNLIENAIRARYVNCARRADRSVG